MRKIVLLLIVLLAFNIFLVSCAKKTGEGLRIVPVCSSGQYLCDGACYRSGYGDYVGVYGCCNKGQSCNIKCPDETFNCVPTPTPRPSPDRSRWV